MKVSLIEKVNSEIKFHFQDFYDPSLHPWLIYQKCFNCIQ